MNPERSTLEKLGKKVGLAATAALAMVQVACAKAEPIRAQAPTPTPSGTEQPIEQQPTPAPEPTNTPQPEPTNTPEPKQDPTATATTTPKPPETSKPPEIESPFPKYGVWEGEFFDGTQTSYMVMTTPLDEKMGALMTYLVGKIECSAGKLNYGFGFISVDLQTFLAPGVKRGRFRDSIDPTYDPQQRSISGRLIIPPDPPDPRIKACDAQNIPFKLKFVGNGPDSFLEANVRSYKKAGLFTDSTRVTMVKERIAKYIGELPPQASN